MGNRRAVRVDEVTGDEPRRDSRFPGERGEERGIDERAAGFGGAHGVPVRNRHGRDRRGGRVLRREPVDDEVIDLPRRAVGVLFRGRGLAQEGEERRVGRGQGRVVSGELPVEGRVPVVIHHQARIDFRGHRIPVNREFRGDGLVASGGEIGEFDFDLPRRRGGERFVLHRDGLETTLLGAVDGPRREEGEPVRRFGRGGRHARAEAQPVGHPAAVLAPPRRGHDGQSHVIALALVRHHHDRAGLGAVGNANADLAVVPGQVVAVGLGGADEELALVQLLAAQARRDDLREQDAALPPLRAEALALEDDDPAGRDIGRGQGFDEGAGIGGEAGNLVRIHVDVAAAFPVFGDDVNEPGGNFAGNGDDDLLIAPAQIVRVGERQIADANLAAGSRGAEMRARNGDDFGGQVVFLCDAGDGRRPSGKGGREE